MTRLIISIVLAAVVSASCQALQWNIEPVYSGGLSQGDATLLYTGSEAPRIVFSAAGEVRLATRSGYAWLPEKVADCGFWGGWSGAALDTSGAPGVAFLFDGGTSTVLKFASKSTGSWTSENVTTVASWLLDHVSLVFDSTNTAWIAFCDGSTVKAARRLGPNNWSVSNVSTSGDVTGPVIAIGPGDVPHISFADSANRALKLARRMPDGSWSVETVDGSLVSPWYTSVAFRPDGSPAVAYFGDASEGLVKLKLAVKSGGVWQKEPIVTLPGDSAQHCSLAFAPDGAPWIAYFDGSASSLACAWKTSSGWVSETVDPSNMSGYRPSIRLDAGGNPAIGYVDSLAGNVGFAAATLPRTVDEVKRLPDGVIVRCEGLVASTEYSVDRRDFTDRHYLQRPDRSMGIMVFYGGMPDDVTCGTEAAVIGVTGTVAGERAIVSPVIVPESFLALPSPVGMNNRSIGGGGFAYSPSPVPTGQKGINGAVGLNNMGLLVTTAGNVVEVDSSVPPKWFKLDDGSAVRVKCILPAGTPAPSGFVTVTGISSCELDASSNLLRLVRVRQPSDIEQVP
ncbi:MAG: hypothetical protein HYX78_07745 [Armatimonadetes bacterium]|nr:hypothetical protein [Armatimonadota bacterium]